MRAVAIKKWVNENKDKYIKQLNLESWTINIIIVNKNNNLEKKNKENESKVGYCAAGSCFALFDYQTARIKLFSPQIDDEDSLRRVFVHELAHVATASLKFFLKFIQHIGYVGSGERELIKKVEKNISEILAMQMERIVLGPEAGHVGILTGQETAEELYEICFSYKDLSKYKPRIILKETLKKQKTPEQLLWDEKKNDEDFWYRKYKEATQIKLDKQLNCIRQEEDKKQIILLKNYVGRR